MRIHIHAVDPGDTTGYASAWFDDEDPDTKGLQIYDYGYCNAKEYVKTVLLNPETGWYDVIVYETWRLRRDAALSLVGSSLVGPQVVGAIRLAYPVVHREHAERKRVELVAQPPSIKPAVNKMMGEGYWPESDVEHDRDALRHLLFYWRTKLEPEGAYRI